MKFGLTDSVINRIRFVMSTVPEIEKVLIYGSRAKGTNREGSDIDLTIIGNVPFEKFNKLSADLDDLNLIYKTDLSLFAAIDNQDLIEHINRVGKVFYQRGDVVIKETERRVTPERENKNERFRVFYWDRSTFDQLRVTITRTKTNEQRIFIINSNDLPETDSIHFSSSIENNNWKIDWDGNVSKKIIETADSRSDQ